jgi:hypothetical protein
LKGEEVMRTCIRKGCLFLAAVFLICVLACQSRGEVLFSDDFESGNLDLWTIDGRQQGLANVAEVTDKHGSKMGHLYHQGFTEIGIGKVFDFNNNMAFSFDMEVEVTGGNYASGDAEIWFRDSEENSIGVVTYMKATSSYIFDLENPLPNREHFRIPDEAGLTSYSVTMQELLTYITIDEDLIDTVKLRFLAYNTGSSSSFTSNVWVDNVVVTPEPATICLLGLAGLMLRRRK